MLSPHCNAPGPGTLWVREIGTFLAKAGTKNNGNAPGLSGGSLRSLLAWAAVDCTQSVCVCRDVRIPQQAGGNERGLAVRVVAASVRIPRASRGHCNVSSYPRVRSPPRAVEFNRLGVAPAFSRQFIPPLPAPPPPLDTQELASGVCKQEEGVDRDRRHQDHGRGDPRQDGPSWHRKRPRNRAGLPA